METISIQRVLKSAYNDLQGEAGQAPQILTRVEGFYKA